MSKEIKVTTQLDYSQVVRVYSGRPGCMCGCRGSYRYPKGTDVAEMDRRRGYANTTINDAQVKKVLKARQRTDPRGQRPH